MAKNIKLGWTVCGKFGESPPKTDKSTLMLCASLSVEDLKIFYLLQLEMMGISYAEINLTKTAEKRNNPRTFYEFGVKRGNIL